MHFKQLVRFACLHDADLGITRPCVLQQIHLHRRQGEERHALGPAMVHGLLLGQQSEHADDPSAGGQDNGWETFLTELQTLASEVQSLTSWSALEAEAAGGTWEPMPWFHRILAVN